MEAARVEVGPSRRIAQQGDFGGKAEVTLNLFFDSSALAKRYIEEKGSDQVQAILSSASALVSRLADLCPIFLCKNGHDCPQ
jgi:hypothetical protein